MLPYNGDAMNAAEIRSDWAGQTVDNRFVLLEWLGGSGDRGTFRTELQGPGSQTVAITLIPADHEDADRRIAGWATVKTLSHPHLMKIFEAGRCEIAGAGLVYVVTEFAEEILSQIIPERALTTEETREMLDPLIDTLSYLHARGFVHGHVKPSNIMVVDNQLKLSSDSLLTSGAVLAPASGRDIYHAPVNHSATVTPAMDVWSLGVTLIAALTQHPPAWDRSSDQSPSIPEGVPEPFAKVARRCLRIDPADRCSLGEVKTLLGGTIGAYHEPSEHHHPRTAIRKLGKRQPFRIPVLWMVIAFLALIAIIAVMNLRSRIQPLSQPVETTRQPPPGASIPRPTPSPAASTSGGLREKGQVASRVLPDVPRHASDTIQGTVKLAVRVHVDATGNVSDADIASPGPSKYFAQLALDSARAWKFKPAQADGHAVPSVWLLRYQFRNNGTEVTPVEETPSQ